MPPSPAFRAALAAACAAAVLTACTAPRVAVVPAGQPPATNPAGTPTTPAGLGPNTRPPATGAGGAIQLIDARLGTNSLVTSPGRSMTLVATAAAMAPNAQPMRLAVSSYRTADADDGMPYRSDLRAAGPIGPVAPARRVLQAPAARTLGSEDRFWINTGDSSAGGDVERPCRLDRVSDHAYFYVDVDAKAIAPEKLDQLVSEWEQRIYPRLTAVFGPEARPGIDGEDRLFIVLSPAVDNWGKEKGLMGYFWSRDAIPGGGAGANSNQKEVLFMTDQLFDRPPLTSYGTLAHEFQHLINFSNKAARLQYRLAEETWLDEGLSMYAMEVAGYGLPAGDYHIAKDLRAFQEAPADYTLTDWTSNPNGFAYGQSYLFVRYMVDRFGENVVKEILGSDRAGVSCVEGVLGARGVTFANHFRDWAIANYVTDDPVAAGTPYAYKDLTLRGTFTSSTGGEDVILRGFQPLRAPGAEVEVALKPWGTAYYAFQADAPQAWRLSLGEGTAGRLLGAVIVP